MSNILNISSLSDAEVYYIIDTLAQERSPIVTKEKFDEFFRPKTIDGNVVIEVAAQFADKIKDLRQKYDGQYEDIRIASTRNQLRMLDELFTLCKEKSVVGVDRNGSNIEKADYPTAVRCVIEAARIRTQEDLMKLKRQELERYKQIGTDGEDKKYEIDVVHSEDEE